MSEAVYIVDGLRTSFAKMGGALAACDAVELGRAVSAALLARTGIDPATLDEVIFGCVGQPADAANLARVISLRAGVPESVPAFTVHRNCASGFEAVTQAADRIVAGRGDIYLVGGTESMSHYPLLFCPAAARKFTALSKARTRGAKLAAAARFRPADFVPRASLLLGLSDPICGLNMGQTAERLARDWRIGREAQDLFALRSHHQAAAAREFFADEIAPVFPRGMTPPAAVTEDDGIRSGQSLAALARLNPVFDRVEAGGTVTAGNASQLTDGAVALLVMSAGALRRSGLAPLGRVVDYAYAGCEPARMGLGPVYAIDRVNRRTDLRLDDADLVEINEAFAVQVLAVLAALGSDDFGRTKLGRDRALGQVSPDILNVHGGAIALGHPVGASGARLVLTALRELRRRRGHRALVSLCVGGGQGGALWLAAP